MAARPLLSILIPTYEYAAGLERILEHLQVSDASEAEILVADDSLTSDVEAVALKARARFPSLRYRRNTPRLGACANWNSLLDAAAGEFCLLLHHDEYPVSSSFVPRVLHALACRDADTLLLGCAVRSGNEGPWRETAPRWLREVVWTHCPGYLCFRNVVGAPSVVIARRAIYPRFDPRLSWLVDVEAYVRLRNETARVAFLDDVVVASEVRSHGSITRALQPELSHVHREELAYVASKHPSLRSLRVLGASSAVSRAARWVEVAAWASVRAAQYVSAGGAAARRSGRRGTVGGRADVA